MAFWTDNFMNQMRTEWLRRIDKIQYKAGSTWYDALITEKTIEGNNIKIMCQTQDNLSLTITAARLLDTSGEVAGSTTESIVKNSTQGVITLWEFPLYELT